MLRLPTARACLVRRSDHPLEGRGGEHHLRRTVSPAVLRNRRPALPLHQLVDGHLPHTPRQRTAQRGLPRSRRTVSRRMVTQSRVADRPAGSDNPDDVLSRWGGEPEWVRDHVGYVPVVFGDGARVGTRRQAPPGLVAVVTASAAALLLSRALSPLWVVLIVGLPGPLVRMAGRAGVGTRPVRCGGRWWCSSPVASSPWRGSSSRTPSISCPWASGGGHEVGWHLAPASSAIREPGCNRWSAVFGWLDTTSPLLTYLVWYAAVGMLILIGDELHQTPVRGVLACSSSAIVLAVPVIISYDEAHQLGVIWQGRYIMPMAVGVPLMAVALIEGPVCSDRCNGDCRRCSAWPSASPSSPPSPRHFGATRSEWVARWTTCTVLGSHPWEPRQ